MRPGVLAVLAAALASAARAQTSPSPTVPEIVTDRPAVTASSIVVPKAILQFESGAAYTFNHGAQTFDLPETLVRLGVAERTEIRFTAPNYSGGIGQTTAAGFGDLTLGMKQQLGPLPGGFDLSVILSVKLPTGSKQASSHDYDPSINFPWSKNLKAGWSIGGMQSLYWNTKEGRRNGVWEPALYLQRQITKPWSAFAEYAGDFAQRGKPREIAHFGTVYQLTPYQQADFHFGFGVSDAAPNHFFAVGYSIRIGKLWGN
jgi:hypothetical protein